MNPISHRFFTFSCCGWIQLVDPVMMVKSNEITCANCNNVKATRSIEGVWYYVGNKVFE